MKRGVVLRSTKAMSPYAQALKHVALRGAVALGPSAKEQELAMYRAGILPADYRPPVQGKWDDTIERWAYSWQFPALEKEDGESESDILKSVVENKEAMLKLAELCRLLERTPPSRQPRSANSRSSVYFLESNNSASGSLTGSAMRHDSRGSLAGAESKTREEVEFYEALEREMRQLPSSAVLASDTPVVESSQGRAPDSMVHSSSSSPYSDAVSSSNVAMTAMMPSNEYSLVTGVPAAYVDDQSEFASASKQLGALMEGSFSLAFEEPGLEIVLRALCVSGCIAEGRTLVRFMGELGLGPTAESYRSLMRYYTPQGAINQSMSIIEELKAAGVTPRIGNWHELMLCLQKARDYPAVQQVVDHMKAYANLEPNEATFAIQLRALSKDQTQQSAVHEAIQLFDQMENVYGYVASRPHYHALMACVCQVPTPDMRLRCEELGRKMELLGMVWDAETYLYQIKAAQVVGDISGVEKLFAKMRNEGVPMNQQHLAWAVHCHTSAMLRMDFKALKEEKKESDVVEKITQWMATCYGIHDLMLRRGWAVERIFLNALLRLSCQATIVVMDHATNDTHSLEKFETQANRIWDHSFSECGQTKDVVSYEYYIALLAHQQRIDEAEKLFQHLCLADNLTPTRRTYEALIFMHIASGEEGGTARALHYLEAMERAKIPIRASLIKKIVKANNAAGYRRDMKRRARRIMQAREEYMARKAEGVDLNPQPYTPPQRDAEGNLVAVPLPVDASSTLVWWENWKRTSASKHELFEVENPDGTPRGEHFDDKNAALRQLGIESKFPTKESLPNPARHTLLPKLRREEGEVTGALWGLDGGELSYPKDGRGPQGWGVRLWRDRQLLRKEHDKIAQGKAQPSPLSTAGNALRTTNDQLVIETSGATTPGELRDVQQFPDLVYDDGTVKPVSEFAVDVPPSAELVWHQERKDRLAPYKTDTEISMEADSTFEQQMWGDTKHKISEAIVALQEKREDEVNISSSVTPTRRGKHDYLAKWREMYRHGTLEVADEPLERFGRSDSGTADFKDTLARTVREWNERNRRRAPSDADIARWEKDEARDAERAATARTLRRKNRRVQTVGRQRLLRRGPASTQLGGPADVDSPTSAE